MPVTLIRNWDVASQNDVNMLIPVLFIGITSCGTFQANLQDFSLTTRKAVFSSLFVHRNCPKVNQSKYSVAIIINNNNYYLIH